jgi:hypothetical protein
MRRRCRWTSLGVLAWLAVWGAPAFGSPAAPLGGTGGTAGSSEAHDCASGVVQDDGDPESGYGFVPSATEGVYVQELQSGELPRRQLAKVCLCLMKTRGESDAEVEVVFYRDAGGRPVDEPYAAVRGKVEDLPRTKETAGRFYEFDVTGVTVPEGASWVGARWNPSEAAFLFICNDLTETTEKAGVFFREDRSPRWTSVFEAKDPIFKPHRAILVRAVAASEAAARSPKFLTGPASSTPVVRYRKE